MISGDEQWLQVADAFQAAAVDGNGWYAALAGLAKATGSRTGELIGVGANAAVPFNIMTNMDPAFHQAFRDAGGGNPEVNPRVGAGMKSPVMKVLAESDFISPEEYRRHPHYQEFARPWDIPYICLATLERQNGMLIGLAVCRSAKEGHITDEQRRVFESLAPHVRAAVRTQIALEGQGTKLLAGALEGMALAAFVADGAGRICAATPAAEDLARGGQGLRLTDGRLSTRSAEETRTLSAAIAGAAAGLATPGRPASRSVLLRGHPAGVPMILDVISLPMRANGFGFGPRVLIVARGRKPEPEQRLALLQSGFGLTAAEAAVAQQLIDGCPVERIASVRGVSIGTIRNQVKSIFAKVGVSRQPELVARLSIL